MSTTLGTSISNSEIDNDAVTSAKIADGTITTTDLAFTPSPLGTSISNNEIDSNAVTTAKIADGTIISADIANGTVTTADLAFTPLTNPYTGDLSVTGEIVATDGIETDNDLLVGDNATIKDGLYVGSTTGGDGDIWLYDRQQW